MLKNPNLDLAGLFTSTLCAIHCTAVPVLLSFGFIESSHWLHNEFIEMVVIGSGLVIAFFSLFKEFKKHLSPIPMLLALVGFTILIKGILHHSGSHHFVLSVLGGILVASSHIYNWKLSTSFSCAA